MKIKDSLTKNAFPCQPGGSLVVDLNHAHEAIDEALLWAANSVCWACRSDKSPDKYPLDPSGIYHVRASVRDSVRASVRDSVWDSVGAYTGSFFKLQEWKYVKHIKGRYPYAPLVKLWASGLVPSFDGTTWRLHAGRKAKIVFEITAEKLRGKA